MNKIYFLFFSFLTFFVLPCTGQNQKEIDSLESIIPTLKNDSMKLDDLLLLSKFIVDIDPDKSIIYAKDALRIAEEKDYKLYQAKSLNSIGNGYYNLADFKTCLDYYLKALKIHESINNKKGIMSSSGAIGNVFIGLGKSDEALEYFERALKIGYEIDNKNGVASCLIAIGTVYSDKKDFTRALEYFFKSLKIFQEINNEDAIATNYNNIADSYQQLKEYPKSLFYITKAAEIYEKTGNIYGQSLAFNNIGDFYNSTGDGKKALEYFKLGLEKGKSIDANDHILQSYKGMSKAYKKLGNYKEALEFHELFQQMNDSVFDLESNRQISEMQTKYETEKKEKEITLLTTDKKIKEDEINRQALVNRGMMIVGILSLLLTFLAIRGYYQKKRANTLLGLKNQKIENAYSIIEDQHKDIKDSINYAKRIQLAILTPDTVFKQLLPQSFILYKPKDIVSGDFYWAEPWGNKVLFAAVDCTGHGVPGAFMSIVGYNLLSKALNEFGLSSPALILNSISKEIGKTLRQTGSDSEVKDGMDIAVCSLDNQTLMLEYSGAFNSLYHIRNGDLTEIKADKNPIGSLINGKLENYTNHKIQLQKGDAIYVFTDGYADQFGGDKGKKFKYKAFEKVLVSIQDRSMEDQKAILNKTIESWKGNLEQVDDILVMGVRI